MLASALFEGALADTVFEADRLLVRLLDLPGEQGHPFEEPDLRKRLAELGAEIGRDGRVRFRMLGYAEAVRRHFWKHFPGPAQPLPGLDRHVRARPAVFRGGR
jgi:hypothetical protein